ISANFFDSEWMFGVEGFDVVIGNPPYIKEYTKKSVFDGLHSSDYYKGKMDLWYFFGAMGLDWLKDGGIETYIAPNNWTTNAGASKFRNKIISDSTILAFLDFGNYKIFESAGIQTMVYILKKNSEIKNYSVKYGKLLNDKVDNKLLEEFINSDFNIKNNEFVKYSVDFKRDKFKDKNVIFLNNNLSKIFKKIKDQADFYLTEKEVANGIHPHYDYVSKKTQQILGNSYKIGDGVFVLSEAEKNKLNLTKKELKLTKPYYTTKQIHKWQCDLKNKEWIIYTDSKFKNPKNIKPYPNIKKHLDKFQKIITSSNKPYGLHRARDEKFFKDEKLIVARKCAEPQFCYTDFDCYVSATFYVIKTERSDLKYLTALLNSKLIKFWLKNQGKMQGDNYQIDKEPLLNLPLKIINAKKQKPFIKLVDQILEKKKDNSKADTGELEKKIDGMVYELYGLGEEREVVINS
ncbi:MAG: Eco57I restriction-modification methylase domain-containing protein, partial [Methanosarcinaceae archaeon]